MEIESGIYEWMEMASDSFDAISGIRGNRCIDFKQLEYSKKSQQNKKNNKYRKIVDNPWKLWYHNIRP